MSRFPGQLAALRQLTLDNPVQTARLLRVERLAGEGVALLRRAIDLFEAEPDRTRALSLARQPGLTGEGKRVMDAIREEVAQMQRAERALLEERAAASRASAGTALATTLVALALGLALVALVIWLLARNLAVRQRAAEVLHAERERFRTTPTSIGDAVVVTEVQGRAAEPGGAGAHRLGRRRERANGRGGLPHRQ